MGLKEKEMITKNSRRIDALEAKLKEMEESLAIQIKDAKDTRKFKAKMKLDES